MAFVWCLILTLQPRAATGQATSPGPTEGRVKVSDSDSSALIIQKFTPTYPEVAWKVGVQGTVVLKVVVSKTGDVEEISTESGDPSLASAAEEAVKKWRYKPYTVDGLPVEMETEVSMTFRLKPAELRAPSLGTFQDQTYKNDDLGFTYPISRDWVRETELMRKRVSADQASGIYILLAAVHIPQHNSLVEADSSFMLSALAKPPGATDGCETHLQGVAKQLDSDKDIREHAGVQTLTISGHQFSRLDFEFKKKSDRRSLLCTKINGYLLEWNIRGLSGAAVGVGIATLDQIRWAQTIPSVSPRLKTTVLRPR